MSYKQMTGNIISATKVEPSGNAASGVWSLQEAFDYVKGNNWPTFANIGLIGGGDVPTYSNVIQRINITVKGNSTDFGDLSVGRKALAACSSSTRGIFGGGDTGSASDVIDFVTIATAGNGTDFGNLAAAKTTLHGLSSNTRGIF